MVEVSISGCQAFVSAFKGCLTLMQFQDAGIYYLCFTGEKKKKELKPRLASRSTSCVLYSPEEAL
jgi:hypothetical protein